MYGYFGELYCLDLRSRHKKDSSMFVGINGVFVPDCKMSRRGIEWVQYFGFSAMGVLKNVYVDYKTSGNGRIHTHAGSLNTLWPVM
jgi:hypothetical protein